MSDRSKTRLSLLASMRIIVMALSSFFLLPTFANQENKIEADMRWQNTVWQQWAQNYPDWVTTIEPFKIVENIYYVGTQGLGAYLIASDQGHILLDGGLPQTAVQIANSIGSLGFKLSDVKFLINSHAHFDHSGGLQELKRLSGAKMVASKLDAPWLESGLYPGSNEDKYKSPPVAVDQTIDDGEKLTLGPISLTARITPGHTPGCTSWLTEIVSSGQQLKVLLFCGAAVAGNRLVEDPQYPGIVKDYRATLKTLKEWNIDVYLSNHPFYFNMMDKREAQIAGNSLAFVNSDEFSLAAQVMMNDFELQLEKQRQAADNLER